MCINSLYIAISRIIEINFFQLTAVEASIIYNDVQKCLLPFLDTNDLIEGLVDNYSLSCRKSAKQIISEFATRLKECQDNYRSNVDAAVKTLQNNLIAANKMDLVFGNNDTDEPKEDIEHKRSGDGKLKLKCPYFDCSTDTSKLRRHLSMKHKLDDDEEDLAMKMARVIAKNASEAGCITLRKTFVKPPNPATAMVAKRHNFVVCSLCSEEDVGKALYKNLGQHLVGVHAFKKDDEEYRRLIASAEVVPTCFTKMVGNKPVALIGEELKEARKIHGEEISKQEKVLHGLKDTRKEITRIRLVSISPKIIYVLKTV